MPLNRYYRGDGPQVMSSMKKRYGQKKGKSVFYATANKNKLTPPKPKSKMRYTPAGHSGVETNVTGNPTGALAKKVGKPFGHKVRPKPKKKVRSAAARRELARDPGDLLLSGKGTRAQERKRDPRGYLA